MSRFLCRPALVPAAMAVGLPCSLVRWSLLAAGLSLVFSALLVVLGMQITRERRRQAVLTARGDVALGWSDTRQDVTW